MMSEAVGITGKDIMFSSNDTPEGEFTKAAQLGAYINLDDYTMIDFLEEECGIPETVFCRYNPGGVYEVSNGIMDNPGDAKYGMTKEQMMDAYRRLQALGAKKFGIHSFLVSNTVTNDYYPMLARTLFELAVELKEKTGAHGARATSTCACYWIFSTAGTIRCLPERCRRFTTTVTPRVCGCLNRDPACLPARCSRGCCAWGPPTP